MYTLACSSGSIVQNDMAVNYYHCGYIILKIDDFRLMILYPGTLGMRQISSFLSKCSGEQDPGPP